MNFLDRTVAFFSPEAGLRRAKSRQGISAVMNYDAASKGRRTYGWKAPSTGPDAAGYGLRENLRQLARDMVRNRALAVRAREVITGSVVGTGIMPSINGDMSEATKAEVAAIVNGYLLTKRVDTLGESTLPMMQETVMNTVVTDGEILVRRRLRDPRFAPGLAFNFQVQVLEADYLNTTVTANGENLVVEGVEYGPTGSIVAYHLWDEHPGSVRRKKIASSTRVPAADIIHVRRMERPGQTRGVSWFAPVMMTLGEISDYQEAQILKQRMAALMAGVVTTEEGGTAPDLNSIQDLAPGAIVGLPPGSMIDWTTPPSVEGYGEFMTENVGIVAIGMGITRESLSGNLKGVNFSSGRMGHMVMDRNVERWQQNIMIDQFCAGLERWIMEAWALNPGLPRAKFSLDWTAPKRPLIDPNREVQAKIDAIEAGLTSTQRTQREMGLDPEVIRRERVEDMTRDKDVGLSAPQRNPVGPVVDPDEEEGDEDNGKTGQ